MRHGFRGDDGPRLSGSRGHVGLWRLKRDARRPVTVDRCLDVHACVSSEWGTQQVLEGAKGRVWSPPSPVCVSEDRAEWRGRQGPGMVRGYACVLYAASVSRHRKRSA
eukprot:113743-Pleurochrysis_carterae.AAC.1